MAIRSLILPLKRTSVQTDVAAQRIVLDLSTEDPAGSISSPPSKVMISRIKPGKRGLRRRFARIAMLTGLSLVLTGATGCSMFSGAYQSLTRLDGLDECMIGHRNRVMAAKAWHCTKDTFCNPSSAFRDGFYEGYMDVANGGSGCIPAVAPAKYWGWMYQSSNGQQAVNDWFAGYPMGVKAAEQDGVGHWSQVRTSRMPPPAPAAMAAPLGLAPAIMSEGGDDDSESPFKDVNGDELDGVESIESPPKKLDSGLEEALQLDGSEGVINFDDDNVFSFSESPSDAPELQPKRPFSATSAPGTVDLGSGGQEPVTDVDSVIDSIFGMPIPNNEIQPGPAESKAATRPSTPELPFSFQ